MIILGKYLLCLPWVFYLLFIAESVVYKSKQSVYDKIGEPISTEFTRHNK